MRGWGEAGRERKEVYNSIQQQVNDALILEPLTSESCNRRTLSTSTPIIDWSHIRAAVRASAGY